MPVTIPLITNFSKSRKLTIRLTGRRNRKSVCFPPTWQVMHLVRGLATVAAQMTDGDLERELDLLELARNLEQEVVERTARCAGSQPVLNFQMQRRRKSPPATKLGYYKEIVAANVDRH